MNNSIKKLNKSIFKTGTVLILAAVVVLVSFSESYSKFLWFGKEKTAHEKKVEQKTKELDDKDPSKRIKAAKELVKLEGKKAAPILTGQLKKEKDAHARARIAEELSSAGNKDVTDELIDIINSEDDKQAKANEVLALGATNDKKAINELQKIFFDKEEDIYVRLQAGNGLSYIKDKEVINIYKKALKDENPRIRKQALVGIHQNTEISYKERVRLVKSVENDVNNEVSSFAKELLNLYGEK